MDAKSAIRIAIESASTIVNGYLSDLTDAQLFHRPAPGCNHINWQLGHLILSEHNMMEGCFPGEMPSLPEGFTARYSRDNCQSDEANQFDSKGTLMALHREQREATLRLLEAVTSEELDRPSPESMRSYAPNVAAAFLMQDIHWTMHAGQWAVVRRQLGYPPLF
jgi:uncharacterized damage-inducible protein DinB